MKDRILQGLGKLIAKKYGTVIIGCIIFTVIMAFFTAQLKLDMSWLNIAPKDSKAKIEMERIIEEYGSAGSIFVSFDAPSTERAIEVLEEVAPKIKDNEYVKRVSYRIDRDYIIDHAFMLQKVKDIKRTKKYFSDINIVPFIRSLNDDFEAEYIEQDENLNDDEVMVAQSLDALVALLETISRGDEAEVLKAVDRYVAGDDYMISSDRRMVLAIVQPTISMNDIEGCVELVNDIEAKLEEIKKGYPDVDMSMTGMHVLARDEMEAGEQDSMMMTLLALVLVYILFVLSFRMWSSPLLAGLALMVGIIWAMGITQLVIGKLNIGTAMSATILVGLGIDFAIHIISGFTEKMNECGNIEESLVYTMTRSGPGIITGGLTTAIAFFALMIAKSRFLVEVGFVTGMGLLMCVLSMMTLMPALIVLRQKRMLKKHHKERKKPLDFAFIANLGGKFMKKPLLTISGTIIITAVFFMFATKIEFDTNLMNMEAKGLASIKLLEEIVDRFHMSNENMIIESGDLEEIEALTREYEKKDSVRFVESITQYLPTVKTQEKRRPHVSAVRKMVENLPGTVPVDRAALAEELERLSFNIMEISDLAYSSGLDMIVEKCDEITGFDKEGNAAGENKIETVLTEVSSMERAGLNRFQDIFYGRLKKNLLRMSNYELITASMLPGDLINRFKSKDKESYITNIYPKKDIWILENQEVFIRDMRSVDEKTTGFIMVFVDMMDSIGAHGRAATLYAFLAILILLLVDFRSIRYTLVAVIPLIFGCTWMLGIMHILGMKITVVNIMAVPLILGIGIDDGVHIIHRYRLEGPGSLHKVLLTTGRAILLTSLTTMTAFGSFVFAKFQGFVHLGSLLFIGVGCCFLMSVFMLPSIIKLVFERKKGGE